MYKYVDSYTKEFRSYDSEKLTKQLEKQAQEVEKVQTRILSR